jgi:tRNA threonylcarbamoyladenosine biosynthesis protein TsaE
MEKIIFEKVTSTTEETEECGAYLASLISEDSSLPQFVSLVGDLGTGKTAFTRGFASLAAAGAAVRSPTYTLVNEYRGNGRPVFHFDVYRIHDEDDLYSIGFYDYLDRRGVCLTEWSENIEESLPESYVRVEITKDDPTNADSRSISIELVGIKK